VNEGVRMNDTSGLLQNSLPLSLDVDTDKLLLIFKHTTASYKYMFLLSLLDILKEHNFTIERIELNRIRNYMLANAWFPHTYFRLSFGLTDQISHYLNGLDIKVSSRILPNYSWKKRIAQQIAASDQTGLDLLRYVPYRLLHPFFADYTQRLPDQVKNKTIRVLAEEKFDEIKPLYFIEEPTQEIVLHPLWIRYFQKNFGLVLSFVKWEWLKFMQQRNPAVPNLQSKLFPDFVRLSMHTQLSFWKQTAERIPLRCVYSRQIIQVDRMTLDHFIPWSFVAHNRLWNLIPVPKSVNSSKSNNLPSIEKYLDRLVGLQIQALHLNKEMMTQEQWNNLIEPYQLDLGISSDHIFHKETLKGRYKATMSPLVDIASNMGFRRDWVYDP
jgi:hypothetical protein